MPPEVWSRRRAAAVVLCTAVLTALAGGGWPASAQIDPVVGDSTTSSSSSTTSTTESSTTTAVAPDPTTPSSTTTTSPGGEPATTTSTTQAPGAGLPGTNTTTTTAPSRPPEPPPPGGGDGTDPQAGAGEFPPELRALMASVRRSGATSTKGLLDALAPLQQYGLSEREAAIAGFGRFPVAGYASYVHDWWFPRFGPGWRLHEGTDIFAAHGTPVRAPVDGHVRIRVGGLGGLAVYVIQGDGTYYYMAHLSALAEGLVDGQQVRTGQVVAFVGDSGNAKGTLPHLHIEIHPRGGGPIDPKPVLDQFLADAVALAPRLVALYAERAAQQEQAAEAMPATTPVEVPPEPPLAAPRAALLWASSANPAGGALQLAEAEAARVVAGIDWGRRLAAQQARRASFEQADAWARTLLAPLLHPALSAAVR